MTTDARRELLITLSELSEVCPEMRMGQLIANLATLARGPRVETIWDVEDDELLAVAREQPETLRGREAQVR